MRSTSRIGLALNAVLVLTVVVLAFAQFGTRASPDQERRGVGGPAGLLETNTLFSVYGRAFGVAPVLGRLGTYANFDKMAAGIRTWVEQIAALNDHKGVIPGVHLIYAMAVPCQTQGDCLYYLEGAGGDIAKDYIAPAAQRGWVVVLDTQLGRSDPVAQVSRMIKRGYLKYDNVHVAIDPEFHLSPGHLTPGIPIGTVTAAQINDVQKLLDDYVKTENLKTQKILIVHQFGDANINDGVPFMIEDKKTLKRFKNVELVIDADGVGLPEAKIRKYNLMTDAKAYPFISFRGIKVFLRSPWELRNHYDAPAMPVEQIFGSGKAPGNLRMASKPNVLIIA